jgi:hypothetical protein
MNEITEVPSSQMKPANTADISSLHANIGAELEYARAELLGITNYMEALCAQIQRAAHGRQHLSLVTNDTQETDSCQVLS